VNQIFMNIVIRLGVIHLHVLYWKCCSYKVRFVWQSMPITTWQLRDCFLPVTRGVLELIQLYVIKFVGGCLW